MAVSLNCGFRLGAGAAVDTDASHLVGDHQAEVEASGRRKGDGGFSDFHEIGDRDLAVRNWGPIDEIW